MITRMKPTGARFSSLSPLFIAALLLCTGPAPADSPSAAVGAGLPDQALRLAGTNRVEIVSAWNAVPSAQREGLRFLLENMPEPDLAHLSSAYLLQNLQLAYEAFEQAPWRASIPPEVFLNDVVPYACLNETRDAWRPKLRALALPLITGCKTPTEAAIRINQKLFDLVKVHYSTERKRADQSPLESMESGKASCTGLSILLADACRAVGIPARVAGTPMWTNERGNHTWVEVWDGGWHFTGASEQDPKGLDRGWFVHDASLAERDVPRHAVYASSYRRTGLSFPMVWARSITWVPALNVTDRYAAAPSANPGAKVRLEVKVLDRPKGRRVAAEVSVDAIVEGKPALSLHGRSRDETADRNDILPFEVPKGARCDVRVAGEGRVVRAEPTVAASGSTLVVVTLDQPRARRTPTSSHGGSALLR
jgi:transglutaminase-like putative cysteine protease